MIKPIDTIYNGYRFRSRLEARWAVFFDTLGIRYEYEKEGYDIDGTWYLPDFWLPDLDCFFEVKGSYKDTGAMWEDWARLWDFCHLIQKCVYIAHGEIRVPDVDSLPGCNFPSTIDGFDPSLSLNDTRRRAYPGTKFPEPFMMWVQSKGRGDTRLVSGMGKSDDQVITHKIIAAYIAARQARFEHGEQPIIHKPVYHRKNEVHTPNQPTPSIKYCVDCNEPLHQDHHLDDICDTCHGKRLLDDDDYWRMHNEERLRDEEPGSEYGAQCWGCQENVDEDDKPIFTPAVNQCEHCCMWYCAGCFDPDRSESLACSNCWDRISRD